MDKADKVGLAVGGTLFMILAPLIYWADADKQTDKFNYGYCYAMGGEMLAEDICAKDGQIIPIPPRP